MANYVSQTSLDKAIRAFINLSKSEFTFILPRKGTDPKTDVIDLVFRPENFSHFLGLHYLTDKTVRKPLESKKLFDKFRRKMANEQPFNLVTEFNEFLKFDYNIRKCDVDKRLRLIVELSKLLTTSPSENSYCRYKKKNPMAAHRNIQFDFAIELKNQNLPFGRIFFFMAKDHYSVNPIAYNPVSIIEQSDDYLAGHIFQDLAIFEYKDICLRQHYKSSKQLIY